MLIQINSGFGPIECERACFLYYQELLKEHSDLVLVDIKMTNKGCAKSIVLLSEDDLSQLDGTVQWICESPFRLNHKRKNWFIDISVLEEEINIDNLDDIRYDVFRSGGKGGQNVNKVSTAIRATHIPSGISVVCMDERSQLQNKKVATFRLIKKLEEENIKTNLKTQYNNWNKHNLIQRGMPYRVYKGLDFKKVK